MGFGCYLVFKWFNFFVSKTKKIMDIKTVIYKINPSQWSRTKQIIKKENYYEYERGSRFSFNKLEQF